MSRCTGSFDEFLTFGFVAGASRTALTSMRKNRKTLGMQLSPVGRYVRDAEAGGSNPLNPPRVLAVDVAQLSDGLFQRIRAGLAIAGLT